MTRVFVDTDDKLKAKLKSKSLGSRASPAAEVRGQGGPRGRADAQQFQVRVGNRLAGGQQLTRLPQRHRASQQAGPACQSLGVRWQICGAVSGLGAHFVMSR